MSETAEWVTVANGIWREYPGTRGKNRVRFVFTPRYQDDRDSEARVQIRRAERKS